MINPRDIRIVIHGSFRRHFDGILEAHQVFSDAGFTVLAPDAGEIIGATDGFSILSGEEGMDPRHVEARYLHNLKRLGENGFSYFVTPRGYIGRSTSFELGIAQLTGVRCFFASTPQDHPSYFESNAVWSPQNLTDYILEHGAPPPPQFKADDYLIHRLWQRLVVPGSVIAAGAIIEHQSKHAEKELLFVRTHKWGGRYSMIGEKVARGERLDQTLLRGIHEETGLHAKIGRHLVTFDQFRGSGYYQSHVNHIFADYVASVPSKRVQLDDEAQDHIWATATEALEQLDLEPNARHTLKLYASTQI